MPNFPIVAVGLLASHVSAHAGMVSPAPRSSKGVDPWDGRQQCGSPNPLNPAGLWPGEYCGLGCVGEACLWYQIGCFQSCGVCGMDGKDLYPTAADLAKAGNCKPTTPTLPEPMRSYNIDDQSTHGDWSAVNPWRAPGTAGLGNPSFNPCGISSGGWPNATTPLPPATGFPKGYPGTDLPALDTPAPVWKAGSKQEVEWSIYANHGGGYQYRLCKKDAKGGVTEDGCQAMPLSFASDSTKIVYYDGSREPFAVPAVTTDSGTWPKGSQWRKNLVPMCNCDLGQLCQKGKGGMFEPYNETHTHPGQQLDDRCPTGVMFETAWDDGYGAGPYKTGSGKAIEGAMPFSMVDEVKVPAEAKGDYVLSFRWDCEATPQVWNSCADITVE